MPQHPKAPNPEIHPEIRHLNNMIDKYTPNIVTCRRHLKVLPQHEYERRYSEHAEKCGTKAPVSRPAEGDKVAWEKFFTLPVLSLLYIIAPLMYPPKLPSNDVFIFGCPPAYG